MTKDELMARLTAIEMKIKNADRDHFTSGGVLAVTIKEVLPLCAAVRELAQENERLKGEYSPEWWADMEAKGEIG